MKRRFDELEIVLQILLAPGILVLPLVYLFTPWLRFADYNLPGIAAYCGVGLMVAALMIFLSSHIALGQNWNQSLELRKGHQLIKNGIYKTIRHPMYTAIWLWCFAQGLQLENWFAGWYAFFAFALMYFIRTPREEQMMKEYFGQEYIDYMMQTGRLFPRLYNKSGN